MRLAVGLACSQLVPALGAASDLVGWSGRASRPWPGTHECPVRACAPRARLDRCGSAPVPFRVSPPVRCVCLGPKPARGGGARVRACCMVEGVVHGAGGPPRAVRPALAQYDLQALTPRERLGRVPVLATYPARRMGCCWAVAACVWRVATTRASLLGLDGRVCACEGGRGAGGWFCRGAWVGWGRVRFWVKSLGGDLRQWITFSTTDHLGSTIAPRLVSERSTGWSAARRTFARRP